MAIVSVRVNGKDYQVACDNGQEEHLQALAFDLDERAAQLAYQMGGNAGEVMTLLLSGLMLVDESIENKKEIDRLSAEVRQLTKIVGQAKPGISSAKFAEMEVAMVDTLNEVSARIERIADSL